MLDQLDGYEGLIIIGTVRGSRRRTPHSRRERLSHDGLRLRGPKADAISAHRSIHGALLSKEGRPGVTLQRRHGHPSALRR